MDPKTLRVRPRGDALVQDYERMAAGVNAFVGRRFTELEPGSGKYGFVPTGGDAEVPFRAEYVKALKDGDLLAADEATAKAARLKFTAPSPPETLTGPVSDLEDTPLSDERLDEGAVEITRTRTLTPPNALRDLKGSDT